jgi:ABC-type multidrug transport system fused ATPase/permease subunit
MRDLPLADPGRPDLRSPWRYLWWIVTMQRTAVLAAVATGVVWMVAQAVMPAIIGRAIDQGVSVDDNQRLLYWTGLLLLAGIIQAVAGIIRHRYSVSMWLDAAYRTVQLVSAHSARLGATLSRRIATGEVVSVGANDIAHIGNSVDALGRAAGSLVAFLVVAALLLSTSTTLGLIVLIGVPLLTVAIGPLLKPLQQRNAVARAMQGELNTLASDIVGGLRVLRGIGGEDVFSRRYAAESQRVRHAGVRVGALQSSLDALQVLLPGIFVVLVVWIGARFAVAGQISAGELVAFYGYAMFLMLPLRTATEFANKLIRARVGADRVLAVLRLHPEVGDPVDPAPEPSGDTLADPVSGFVARPGRLTALVSEAPATSAALADRLGHVVLSEATLGGVPMGRLPREVQRRRVLVSDTTATLFSGRLRDELTGRRDISEQALAAALHTASAGDVLEALPGGLDATVEERGRSFSGGQRQRLVLARALLADPPVLVLVEPTSAVDAHTEARVADRLLAARAGRTTVVVTASPLLLDRVDEVAFLQGERVVAAGAHRDLLDTVPAYRATVTREED